MKSKSKEKNQIPNKFGDISYPIQNEKKGKWTMKKINNKKKVNDKKPHNKKQSSKQQASKRTSKRTN